ncbi:protein Brevis radix-like 3 [Abeliophyllum distichum]|uniref:Protein Brevis radix-like 3 n=1 Tax=Abeliophyllum distichum TaxID=126358 RepID=A0ABD1VY67_9LAMI
MSRNYDNWERLVKVVLRREQYWQMAHDHSRNTSTSSLSLDFDELSLSLRREEINVENVRKNSRSDSINTPGIHSTTINGIQGITELISDFLERNENKSGGGISTDGPSERLVEATLRRSTLIDSKNCNAPDKKMKAPIYRIAFRFRFNVERHYSTVFRDHSTSTSAV